MISGTLGMILVSFERCMGCGLDRCALAASVDYQAGGKTEIVGAEYCEVLSRWHLPVHTLHTVAHNGMVSGY